MGSSLVLVTVWLGRKTGLLGPAGRLPLTVFPCICLWAFVFLFQEAPQPLMEKDQLHLARKLEELKARLALGTREASISPLNPKTQEEGKCPGNRQVGP